MGKTDISFMKKTPNTEFSVPLTLMRRFTSVKTLYTDVQTMQQQQQLLKQHCATTDRGATDDLWPLLSRAWQGPVCRPPFSELQGPPPGTRQNPTAGWCRSLQSPEMHNEFTLRWGGEKKSRWPWINPRREQKQKQTQWTWSCLGICLNVVVTCLFIFRYSRCRSCLSCFKFTCLKYEGQGSPFAISFAVKMSRLPGGV